MKGKYFIEGDATYAATDQVLNLGGKGKEWFRYAKD
jgi:hypothetical protein